MTIKPYLYPKKSNRQDRMRVNRLKPPKVDDEQLTGFVNGERASDLEERFARALRAEKIDFSFQVQFSTAVSLVGEDKVVDFVVNNGLQFPVDINGSIGHTSSAQRGKDAVREALLNEVFSYKGMQPLQVVWWYELDNQQEANAVVKRMFA